MSRSICLFYFLKRTTSSRAISAAAAQLFGKCESAKNPIDLLSWIPQYQLVAATRFHALVLAARGNIPFIGWGSQKKVETLCKEREMPYLNTDEKWDEEEQFHLLVTWYQSRNKSVILGSRTA